MSFKIRLLINRLWFLLVVFHIRGVHLFNISLKFLKNPFLLGEMERVANLTLGDSEIPGAIGRVNMRSLQLRL